MKLAFIGQPEYFRFCYESDLNELGDVREFPFHFGMKESDFDDLVHFSADFNFFFRGEYFPSEILKKLNGFKVALSSEPFPRFIDNKLEYTADSIKRYLDFRSRIRCADFDYVFHYDESSLEFLRRDGLLASGSFPFPVATKTYIDRELPKEWDIFFIGRSTVHRENYFGQLKHKHHFLHICHGIFGPPLIDYICKSKVCLNVHAEPEISWEPRMQMLLACGAFVISEKITPNKYLRPGIDYIEVASPNEMHESVDYYIKNESDRQRIARSGYERVRELLASEKNFSALLQDIRASNLKKFATSKPSFFMNAVALYFGTGIKLKRIVGY